MNPIPHSDAHDASILCAAKESFNPILTPTQLKAGFSDDAKALRYTSVQLAMQLLATSSDDLIPAPNDDPVEAGETFMEMMEYIGHGIEARKQDIEFMHEALSRCHVMAAKCYSMIGEE